MKPNDENGKLPTSERPFRALIISGSGRRRYNCPGVDSKSRALMPRTADRLRRNQDITPRPGKSEGEKLRGEAEE